MIIEEVGKAFGKRSVDELQAVCGRQLVFWGKRLTGTWMASDNRRSNGLNRRCSGAGNNGTTDCTCL